MSCLQYLITFLEGVITFISPCLLPMLPLYISYFAGSGEGGRARTLKNALGFIAGFTLVFVLMGLLAGTAGLLLRRYQTALNIVTGALVVLFGLHYAGAIRIGLLDRTRAVGAEVRALGFFSSLLFGAAFSISWTPCVGAFLSSALMLAMHGSQMQSLLLLLCYSLGLGIPFFLSALLIDRLKTAFDFIKRHYQFINRVAGLLLVALGVMMMTGTMGWMLRLLSA